MSSLEPSTEHALRSRPPMCMDEERCADLFDSTGGKPFQRLDIT